MDCRYKDRFMMKRIVILFAAALALLCSCEKPDTVIDDQSPEYSGKMTVVYEGESFEQKDVKVIVGFNEDKTMVDVKLCKVKFVPAMPVRIDVTIMDVPVTETEEGVWEFYGDGITPWAMGGPYDGYRADEFKGTITSDTLDFTLGFYNTKKKVNYPTTYSGRL